MERFTALMDFYSEETKSHYINGLGYNIDNSRLSTLVAQWVVEGKVERVGGPAKIAGFGTVE